VEYVMTNVVVLDAVRPEAELGTAQQRVDVGAALLDQTVHGWYLPGRVDLTTLDQRFTERCVLGQLFGGNWLTGVLRLFEGMPAGARYVAAEHAGFWVNEKLPEGSNTNGADLQYEELTVQWRRAIVARRETWR
jgi:hypothetical protein